MEMQPITSVLMTDRNKEIKENREHVNALLKVTPLLGRLGTAFRGTARTLIQATRSELTDLCSDTSFVSLFKKAKDFATELEIEVPAVNEPMTRPSSGG